MDSRVDTTERDTDGGDDATKGQVGVAGNRPTRRARFYDPSGEIFPRQLERRIFRFGNGHRTRVVEDSAMPWLPQVVKGLEPVESR